MICKVDVLKRLEKNRQISESLNLIWEMGTIECAVIIAIIKNLSRVQHNHVGYAGKKDGNEADIRVTSFVNT